ncbi:MAG: DUF1697 domain-containing protein [Alphaproteobacteria bacterium]|nr:DUF1697 domain-containing protein [Alphaproteobacteria bacterium]MBU1562346.1 DUF1697 domain-containing protein [Alphaproteobacteria bacterium]MBU2302682.1 DUF1697 domain-containing protein [Alphaproteobacteria bacterium]MBU2369251.1 DUF1697 domain-containing protein [Alphaproteobacteria bacterium]
MGVWLAFLRGINLGKRQMKMAELRACLEADGFAEVKTVLASGNVRFSAEGSAAALKARLEKLMADRFGFAVGVVLRSEDEIKAMLAGHPFASLDPKADVTRHVLMFEQALPAGLQVEDRPGHTEILRIDPRDIYIAGYRQPNGRYTEGVEDVLKPLYARLDKPVLDTMRNWNTIEKVLT